MKEQKKHRFSRQRQLVLDAVNRHHDHPNADQLFLEIHEQDEKISRGTVYRNLHLLVESGDILQVHGPDSERFDCRTDRHDHLLCSECGALLDAPGDYDNVIDREMEERTGCIVQRHETVFNVICPECQRRKKRP
ncbi:MAG: Fur family transcriptional regulator [Sphaerochaetaceae bacterium]